MHGLIIRVITVNDLFARAFTQADLSIGESSLEYVINSPESQFSHINAQVLQEALQQLAAHRIADFNQQQEF